MWRHTSTHSPLVLKSKLKGRVCCRAGSAYTPSPRGTPTHGKGGEREMSHAEIRDANWPKLRSMLETQMAAITSKLELVQVSLLAAQCTASALQRSSLPLLVSSSVSQVFRGHSGMQDPAVADTGAMQAAGRQAGRGLPLSSWQQDRSLQLCHSVAVHVLCMVVRSAQQRGQVPELLAGGSTGVLANSSCAQDMVVQISSGGDVKFQKSYLEDLVRDLQAMRSRCEPILARLASYGTDEAAALMSRALEMMDTITNTVQLKDEVGLLTALPW